ncbi:HNH endonuclease signature motif containing protein [Prauserella aidingensis]|uniref:HNH endonuclease signature motif containing protein n=1 Tax=Prauserella aidingensis TaxID=387890 RepID=UPI0020A39A98|nr:HNH endonuclease signature motif containing protein [Prauserella aidingensis]
MTADFVKVRDRECRFPGCHRPAEFADLDHVRPHGCDGTTCEGNLVGLCRRHHIVKHTPGWEFELEADGSLRITTPEGTVRTGKPIHLENATDRPKGAERKRRRRRGNRRNRNRTNHGATGNRARTG